MVRYGVLAELDTSTPPGTRSRKCPASAAAVLLRSHPSYNCLTGAIGGPVGIWTASRILAPASVKARRENAWIRIVEKHELGRIAIGGQRGAPRKLSGALRKLSGQHCIPSLAQTWAYPHYCEGNRCTVAIPMRGLRHARHRLAQRTHSGPPSRQNHVVRWLREASETSTPCAHAPSIGLLGRTSWLPPPKVGNMAVRQETVCA